MPLAGMAVAITLGTTVAYRVGHRVHGRERDWRTFDRTVDTTVTRR